MAEDKEVRKARQNVERRQEQHWAEKVASGRQARIAEGAAVGLTDEQSQRQKIGAAAGMAAAGVLAASLVTAPSANAYDIGLLERMSQERNATMHSPQQTPTPAGPRAPLTQPSQHLTCMSTTPWQPVLAQPNGEAPTLGKTQPQVAATGRTVNGYAEIRYYNGQTGYVPAPQVHPYQSTVKPGAKCSVAGVRQNGAPVFQMG